MLLADTRDKTNVRNTFYEAKISFIEMKLDIHP